MLSSSRSQSAASQFRHADEPGPHRAVRITKTVRPGIRPPLTRRLFAVRGSSSVQPRQGDTIRALRKLLRGSSASPFLFVSEHDAPFTRAGFQKLVARAGVAAGFEFLVHPHVLRHAAGYKLANDGVDTRTIQAYLGHRNIQHTVKYTELNGRRFKGLWD